ncbi:MAG: radical SAM protein [Chloroflexi bacterium]|nr:MAG: radical SAM protein [Chloroflexota bacterium]
MFDKLGKLFQSRPQRPYRLFQIEPSLECNLDCVMCPWRELRPESAQMSWETFSRIAAYLPLAQGVDFTGGGEPTTNPLLDEMVRSAREAGCTVGFSTNATLLDQGLAETLVALGQDWISFSVDGATAETYERIRQGSSFDTVLQNIETLHRIKQKRGVQTPRMMMVFVMMQENYHELPRYVELAHELGVEHIIFKNLDVILKDEDDRRRMFSHNGVVAPDLEQTLAEAKRLARQHAIGLRLYELQPREQPICEHDPLHNLFFNWAGLVSPCITLAYAEQRVFNGQQIFVPPRQFGDINRQTLEEIWHQPDYQAFRHTFQARVRHQREALLSALVGSESGDQPLPPAPDVCQTCYYLYGI